MAAPEHVLVTRPAGQADDLMASLDAAGIRASHVPALSITPLPLAAAARQWLFDLDHYRAVVVVSVNAAHMLLDHLQTIWPQWPQDLPFVAVGPATAAVLAAEGVDVVMPPSGFNSEAVLDLPLWHSFRDGKVLLAAGEGGRTLLTDTLRDSGFVVDNLVLYRRGCDQAFRWPSEPVDALMVTSEDGWHCLEAKVPADCIVLAGSERIADVIRLTFTGRVLAARSPRDEDMMALMETL